MTAAGWYPEAPGSTVMRWWDGSQWTEHVLPEGPPAEAKPVTDPGRKHIIGMWWTLASVIIGLFLSMIGILPFGFWLVLVLLAVPVMIYRAAMLARSKR